MLRVRQPRQIHLRVKTTRWCNPGALPCSHKTNLRGIHDNVWRLTSVRFIVAEGNYLEHGLRINFFLWVVAVPDIANFFLFATKRCFYETERSHLRRNHSGNCCWCDLAAAVAAAGITGRVQNCRRVRRLPVGARRVLRDIHHLLIISSLRIARPYRPNQFPQLSQSVSSIRDFLTFFV